MSQSELNIELSRPMAWNGRLYMFVTAATDTGHSAALEPGGSFAIDRRADLDPREGDESACPIR